MENENRGFFNSPVIHKNTPIKRLGLSRKRKSSGSVCSVNAKIKAFSENFSEKPSQSEVGSNIEILGIHFSAARLKVLGERKLEVKNQKFLPEKQSENATSDNLDEDESAVNYDEEIELLKRKIAEDEEKLKTLKSNENNINQLEGLIEVWKNGCKSAFLHFSELLKDRQREDIDFKAVLVKLGVWETIVENFESDSEMSLSEFSQ